MKSKNTLGVLALLIGSIFAQGICAQDAPKDDSRYYDSWVGKWFAVVDGKTAKDPKFVVTQGFNKNAYEEIWISEGYISKAWRGWNSQDKRWDFAWVTDDGLFQIWEGKKLGGTWYMYKTFNIKGEEVLSRQAFVMENDRTMIRTSEHSKDKGKTWQLRFKEKYVKGK
ncbi:MAG: hypothetical protein HKN25_04000 [Pyrinomonadaceae bacterium]|nr:hypothetical protein [Pyrinomonadaceae bacterium]